MYSSYLKVMIKQTNMNKQMVEYPWPVIESRHTERTKDQILRSKHLDNAS